MRRMQSSKPALLLASTIAAAVGFAGAPAVEASSHPEPVTRWVQRRAAPLDTVDPSAPLDDMAPLRQSIGDAEIVGLGESVHGASEELTLKHRALRVLVEQMGFRSIAWEEDWAVGRGIDAYIRGGEGDLGALVSRMSPQWHSREVADVLRWLRDYNRERSDQVRFVGVEYYLVTTPGGTLRRPHRWVLIGSLAMTTIGELPEVVSREEWLTARKELLADEKAVTRARDQVNADRRRLPMVRIDKPYTFEGPDGKVGLLDMFEGRSQLVMHHFMWVYDIDPDGVEHPRDTGCTSCSSAADRIGELRQLHARDTTLVAVTRAPYAKLAAFRERMGWTFPWYSSAASDFNYDFHATVDERVAPVQIQYRSEPELAAAGTPFTENMRGDYPGISAFLRVGDEVFHTYSTFGRGIEEFHYGIPHLDLTALGRQEPWEQPKGRATPLGLHAGGPRLRFPDEYDA